MGSNCQSAGWMKNRLGPLKLFKLDELKCIDGDCNGIDVFNQIPKSFYAYALDSQ